MKEFTEVKQEMMDVLTVNQFISAYGYIQLVQALKYRIDLDMKDGSYYNVFTKYQCILDKTLKKLVRALNEYKQCTSETMMDKVQRILAEKDINITIRNNDLKTFVIEGTDNIFLFASYLVNLLGDNNISYSNIIVATSTGLITIVINDN